MTFCKLKIGLGLESLGLSIRDIHLIVNKKIPSVSRITQNHLKSVIAFIEEKDILKRKISNHTCFSSAPTQQQPT